MRARAGGGGDAGLSLVEMLVALALFALIGVAGLTMLDGVLRVNARTEGRIERLAEIDRAFTLMRRDLLQMAPGPVTLNGGALAFTREGAGPTELAFEDGTLLRRVLAGDGSPVAQRLLGDLDRAEWRLLGQDWRTDWPADADLAPRAAELTLALTLPATREADEITRLFPLPAAAAR